MAVKGSGRPVRLFAKGLKPVESVADLERFVLDVWDSDADLDAFLADVRASRSRGVA